MANTISAYVTRSWIHHQPNLQRHFAWSKAQARKVPCLTPTGKSATKAIPSAQGGEAQQPHLLLGGLYDPRQQDVRAALHAAQRALIDRFVIIDRSPQSFMQCLCQGGHWWLEKQEGGEDAHYRAMLNPREAAPMNGEQANKHPALISRIFSSRPLPRYSLDIALTCDAMERYFKGEPEPSWLRWERMELL